MIHNSFHERLCNRVRPIEPRAEARSGYCRGSGDDSEEAWAIREKIKSNYLDKPGVKEGLADSLAGLKNERAWQLRDELKDQVLFNVFEGLVGVDDEKSWELRNKYQELMMPSVANSLIGLSGKKVNGRSVLYEDGTVLSVQ
jgi:hypothetical protein